MLLVVILLFPGRILLVCVVVFRTGSAKTWFQNSNQYVAGLEVTRELVRCLLPVLTCDRLDTSKGVERLRLLHLHLVVYI